MYFFKCVFLTVGLTRFKYFVCDYIACLIYRELVIHFTVLNIVLLSIQKKTSCISYVKLIALINKTNMLPFFNVNPWVMAGSFSVYPIMLSVPHLSCSIVLAATGKYNNPLSVSSANIRLSLENWWPHTQTHTHTHIHAFNTISPKKVTLWQIFSLKHKQHIHIICIQREVKHTRAAK